MQRYLTRRCLAYLPLHALPSAFAVTFLPGPRLTHVPSTTCVRCTALHLPSASHTLLPLHTRAPAPSTAFMTCRGCALPFGNCPGAPCPSTRKRRRREGENDHNLYCSRTAVYTTHTQRTHIFTRTVPPLIPTLRTFPLHIHHISLLYIPLAGLPPFTPPGTAASCEHTFISYSVTLTCTHASLAANLPYWYYHLLPTHDSGSTGGRWKNN